MALWNWPHSSFSRSFRLSSAERSTALPRRQGSSTLWKTPSGMNMNLRRNVARRPCSSISTQISRTLLSPGESVFRHDNRLLGKISNSLSSALDSRLANRLHGHGHPHLPLLRSLCTGLETTRMWHGSLQEIALSIARRRFRRCCTPLRSPVPC